MLQKSGYRNSSIDILKFIFAISIVLFHFGSHREINILQGGYIFVEGFFMITGYFMMVSANKTTEKCIGKDTLNFIKHKYLSFAPTLIASVIITQIITIIISRLSPTAIALDLLNSVAEIIPLQITGIRGSALTAVAWYLSAMMIALFILYPAARKFGKSFTHIFCPVVAVMIYGILCKEVGFLNTIAEYDFFIPVQSGIFRAVAGICTGCMLYECIKATEKYKVSRFGEVCFLGVELISLAFIFFVARFLPKTYYDFYTLPAFFVLLYCCFGRKSVISKRFSFNFTKYFGTASLIIYLNHNNWKYHPDIFYRDSVILSFVIYLLLVLGACVAVAILTILLRKFWKFIKKPLKKHFVGETSDFLQ